MPYKSDAQRRYFHAAAARGDISKKTVHEFDEASKGKKLPEKAKKKMNMGGYSDGGEVGSPIYEYESSHNEMNMPPDVRYKYNGSYEGSVPVTPNPTGRLPEEEKFHHNYADGGPVSPEEAAKIAQAMGMPKPKPPKQFFLGGEAGDASRYSPSEYLESQVNPDMDSEEGSKHTEHHDSPSPEEGYDRWMTIEPGQDFGKPSYEDALSRQEYEDQSPEELAEQEESRADMEFLRAIRKKSQHKR